MSLAVSFCGLKGVDRAQVLEALGAAETGTEAFHFEVPLAWGAMEEGWLVLAARDIEFVTPELLEKLSQGGEAVGCQIEEHVMAAMAWGYRDGAQVWSLDYDCDKSDEVRITGAPPLAFSGVYEKAKAAQAAEDEPVDHIWGVPSDLFAAITGYRFDEEPPAPFTELALPATVGAKRGGLFGLLFGRRSS
jgi:hypothetical protein